MKLIWLSHFIPFPPRGGAAQRSYHLFREACRHHETILIAFNRPAVDGETLQSYSTELRRLCADVEFWDLPFPWKGARWWVGLAGNAVQALPHSCEIYRSSRLMSRWTDILRAHPDALVHLDSSDLAVFAQAAAGHRILLNHHNCESAMIQRRASVEPNPVKKFLLTVQARKQATLERDLCSMVSVNAVVSSEDGDSLRRQCPAAHIHVVANGSDTDYFVPEPGAIKPNTVVFAGSLRWYPNISALRYFRTRIWPRLKATMPEIECIVAGKSPVPEIVAWAASDSAVTLVGSPVDIRPWIAKGAVFVCPIIDGGGTRLKLLDAMSAGKAIVSTRVGAEGLGIESGDQAMIADSEDEFVERTLEVLRNPMLQVSLARNARDFVERHFGWDTIGTDLEAAYSCPGCPANEPAPR